MIRAQGSILEYRPQEDVMMDLKENFIVESDPGERRLWRLTGWERIRFLVEDDTYEPHRDEALD